MLAAKQGDMRSKNKIGYIYLPYAKSVATDFYNAYRDTGIEFDDFFIIAMNAVFIAIDNFNPKKFDSFYPFWEKIARHEIFHFIRMHAYQYGGKTYAGVPFSESTYFGSLQLCEQVGEIDEDVKNVRLIDLIKDIIDNPKNNFSRKEKRIVELFLLGYDLTEISKIFKTGVHNIYYIFNNTVKKVREIIDNENLNN